VLASTRIGLPDFRQVDALRRGGCQRQARTEEREAENSRESQARERRRARAESSKNGERPMSGRCEQKGKRQHVQDEHQEKHVDFFRRFCAGPPRAGLEQANEAPEHQGRDSEIDHQHAGNPGEGFECRRLRHWEIWVENELAVVLLDPPRKERT
jgi:hypothetical protein